MNRLMLALLMASLTDEQLRELAKAQKRAREKKNEPTTEDQDEFLKREQERLR